MYSVRNMLAKESLADLLAILPDGEWPVLRDGDPYGTANVDRESEICEFRSTKWYAFLEVDWTADAEEADAVYSARDEQCLKDIIAGTRSPCEGHRLILTNHHSHLMAEWDTGLWTFYEV